MHAARVGDKPSPLFDITVASTLGVDPAARQALGYLDVA
jgi:hypothetical protein